MKINFTTKQASLMWFLLKEATIDDGTEGKFWNATEPGDEEQDDETLIVTVDLTEKDRQTCLRTLTSFHNSEVTQNPRWPIHIITDVIINILHENALPIAVESALH